MPLIPVTIWNMAPVISQLVEVSPVALPDDSAVQREPPRPPEGRQPGYEEQFDALTLFYDVFWCGRCVMLVGPPLLNLEGLAFERISARGRSPQLRTLRLDRAQRTVVRGGQSGAVREALQALQASGRVVIGPDLAEFFRGSRVLVTKSKDNPLDWVREWAKFHARTQAVNAVLIYDNGSTSYSVEDLLATLRQVQELDRVTVVVWPFKFGPQAPVVPKGQLNPWWDSDFCQYGLLEHARWRLLRFAAGVINADIDELLLSPPGTTVFDYALKARCGVVQYTGTWVDNVPTGGASRSAYRAFPFTNEALGPCRTKWCSVPGQLPPGAQWRVHDVVGTESLVHPRARPWLSSPVSYRHFLGMTTGWRYARPAVTFDPSVHRRDRALEEALEGAGM